MTSVSQPSTVRLERIRTSAHQVFLTFACDDTTFSTNYWYPEINLTELRSRVSEFEFDRLMFHIAAFEINKICSFRPRSLDLRAYEGFVDPAFRALWTTIFENVWAQWRYENNITDYRGPEIIANGPATNLSPLSVDLKPRYLNFCGGGKDSLVSATILSENGVDFDSLFYSSSIYGSHAIQHQIAKPILEAGNPRNIYKQWIFEDYFEAPFYVMGGDGRPLTRTAAETPSSIFSAVPLAVSTGSKFLVLGHEKSADTGQVFWPATGEDVNHQWGKSLEAEELINSYLTNNLVNGISYFSLLKPIYDTLIFFYLNKRLDLVPKTNSCNIDKPWCGRCPKCAYVYLGYAAMLPLSVVDATFPSNFIEDAGNYQTYRELAGLTGKMPFECIGQADETKLMLHLAKKRQAAPDLLAKLVDEVGPISVSALVDKYTKIYPRPSHFPETLYQVYLRSVEPVAKEARDYIIRLLG